MTKQEALEFVNSCSDDYGFMIVAIDSEDLYANQDELPDTVEKFKQLPSAEQSQCFSDVATAMQETYEEYLFRSEFIRASMAIIGGLIQT